MLEILILLQCLVHQSSYPGASFPWLLAKDLMDFYNNRSIVGRFDPVHICHICVAAFHYRPVSCMTFHFVSFRFVSCRLSESGSQGNSLGREIQTLLSPTTSTNSSGGH